MIVFGLVLGSVFTFGTAYWSAPIDLEDAVHVEATFSFYEENNGYRQTRYSQLHFTDYKTLDLDRVCESAALEETLKEMPSGTKLSLMIHPNSYDILDIHCNGIELLAFDDAMEALNHDKYGYFAIGAMFYLFAVYCAAWLIRYQVLLTRYRRQKQLKKKK